MSYVVFARKWRPSTFAEVVGQEHVTVTLENAIKSNRLASAYLFSGPRGVGKTTTARILAKALNCEQGPTPIPCNTCTPCLEIARGHHIDVLEIDGASNRGIDEIRNLRESTRYTPARSRNKIYIVDEVHMLTTEAFNALLKTLEEPPPHVVFIFATTELHKVLPTILSRCQRFDFRRLSAQQIVDQLHKMCQQEKIAIDDGALHLIAKKADGAMRDAQSLLDQAVSYCGTTVKEKEVAELLGLVQQDVYLDIGDAILGKDIKRCLDISRQVYEKGLDINALMSGLISYFSDMLRLKATGSTAHLLGMEAYHQRYEQQAGVFGETDLIRMVQVVSEAAAEMRRSMNPQVQFENTLLKLAKMSPSVELEQLLAGIEEIKKKSIVPETPRPQVSLIPEIDPARVSGSLFSRLSQLREQVTRSTAPANGEKAEGAPTKSAPISLEEVLAAWPQIVNEVKTHKIALGSFLQEGKPVRVHGNTVDVLFRESNGYNAAMLNEHRREVQEIIYKILGKQVQLHCVSGEVTSPEREHAATAPSPAVVEDAPVPSSEQEPAGILESSPLVSRIVESLEGEPIDSPS